MAKRKWSDAVDRGIAVYRSGDYVYLYGAPTFQLAWTASYVYTRTRTSGSWGSWRRVLPSTWS